jgi:hypothetical protein
VIDQHVPPQGFDKEHTDIGIAGLDVDALTEDEDLAQVFLHLFYKDYRIKRGLMNVEVERKNKTMQSKNGHVKKFTDSNFLTGIALMIGAGALDGNGCTLWKSERLRQKKNHRKSIVTIPDFEHHRMPYWRLEQFRRFVPVIREDKSKQETYEWWRFISALDEFNERRKTIVTVMNFI